MIATAHSPNYLAGLSVFRKVAEADVVLWLDEVRYTTPGWQDRNQLPDGSWLTVPVERDGPRSLLRDVRIVGDVWAEAHVAALREAYAAAPHFDEELLALLEAGWQGKLLVELTKALNSRILALLGLQTREVWQSGYRLGGRSISERLVRTLKALGADVYLSGPSGWQHLDVTVFEREGIELRFHSHVGPNPCVVDPIFRTGRLDYALDGPVHDPRKPKVTEPA